VSFFFMSGGGLIRFRRPPAHKLGSLLTSQRESQLSYATPGMTQGTPPLGYRVSSAEVDLGEGSDIFDAAVGHLRNWRVHAQSLQTVIAKSQVTTGTTVILVARIFPIYVTMACRVVYTIDAENAWGFAYGTLPHHVEKGEEQFLVSKVGQRVHFSVTGYSRAGHSLTVVAGPIGKRLQKTATERYVSSMEQLLM
jgi:uncharacterized protein (UPF0548 family)